jgi:RHS repeat-associated protein
MRAAAPGLSSRYPYAGIAYANPDAPTQIANGLSTTTFTYDNNGNVTQKTVDGTTTTYVYDYANRLTALGVGGATTTYGYDAFGQRVLQTGTTTTYLYPFKWYSVASSTGTGAKYATTTDYVFNGDSLVATEDQQTASGNATGTAKTRYIHPDHLGSTNVVTDENGNVVQTLDYYPYGSTRISVATSTNERRKFISQFADDSTLSYLQARYYDSGRGQFLSEDPVFLGKKQNLTNPQSLNSYSYANDNPITISDPNGMSAQTALQGVLTRLTTVLQSLLVLLSQPSYVTYAQAAQAGVSNAQHPIKVVQNSASAVYSYAANTGSALSTVGRSDAGDFLLGERAVDAATLLLLRRVPFASDAAAPSEGAMVPQILLNKAAGDAFRDSVAATMRAAGYDVQTEVYKATGLGARYIDIDVSKNGTNLGEIETKVRPPDLRQV